MAMTDKAPTPTADDWRPTGTPTPWPGKCGHCGFQTDEVACPRCGLWGGVTYKTSSVPAAPSGPKFDLASVEAIEADAFIAGFICAGGNVDQAKSYAASFKGCMHFHRVNTERVTND